MPCTGSSSSYSSSSSFFLFFLLFFFCGCAIQASIPVLRFLSPINNSYISYVIIYIIYPSSTQVTYCSLFWKSDLRTGQLFMLCVLGGTLRVISNYEFESMLNGSVTAFPLSTEKKDNRTRSSKEISLLLRRNQPLPLCLQPLVILS